MNINTQKVEFVRSNDSQIREFIKTFDTQLKKENLDSCKRQVQMIDTIRLSKNTTKKLNKLFVS